LINQWVAKEDAPWIRIWFAIGTAFAVKQKNSAGVPKVCETAQGACDGGHRGARRVFEKK
jgi:hypothetical protein